MIPGYGVPSSEDDIAGLIRQTFRDAGREDLADTATRIARIESSFNPRARNQSGASGLFQFMPDTWAKHGAGGDPFNPVQAARAAVRLMTANETALRRVLGREPSAGELYLAHQQGANGAVKLLQNPDAEAASLVGEKAVLQNGGRRGQTARQFVDMWSAKVGQAPFKRLVEAAARLDPIGAMINHAAHTPILPPIDPSFDPFRHIKGTPLERHAARFVDVRNEDEFWRRVDLVQQQEADATYLAEGGFRGVMASLAVGAIDPLNYIPLGVGRAGVFRGALMGGASGAAAAGGGEVLLHAAGVERGWSEAGWSVGLGTVLGAVLGGASGRMLSAGEMRKVVEAADAGYSLAASRRTVTPEPAVAAGPVRSRVSEPVEPPSPVGMRVGAAEAAPLLTGLPSAPRIVTPAEIIAATPRTEWPIEAVMPGRWRIGVKYEVVDVGQLKQATGELQPRARETKASQVQIAKIAQNIEPTLLGGSATIGDGAPIVGPDDVIEAGNGRVRAINMAYEQGGAGGYRAWIEAQGFETKGMERPVLIRRRTTELDETQRVAFVRDSNVPTAAAMGAVEQSAVDARSLTREVLASYKGGKLDSAENVDFVRAFFRDATNERDLPKLVTPEGRVTVEGLRRLQAALLQAAYSDAPLIRNLIDNPDPALKSISRAMLDAAPDWALMRVHAEQGLIADGLDLTDDLLSVVEMVKAAKRSGLLVRQSIGDLFKETSTETLALLDLFFKGNRARAAKSIADVLRYYARRAIDDGQVSLFGEPARSSEILGGVRARLGLGGEAAEAPVVSRGAGEAGLFERGGPRPAGGGGEAAAVAEPVGPVERAAAELAEAPVSPPLGESSAGAEQALVFTPRDMEIKGAVTRALATASAVRGLPIRNPDLSLATSPSRLVRETAHVLTESHLPLAMHDAGSSFGPSAEAQINGFWGGLLAQFEDVIGVGDNLMTKARTWLNPQAAQSVYARYRLAVAGTDEAMLSFREIREAAGRASRRLDKAAEVTVNGVPLGKAAQAAAEEMAVQLRTLLVDKLRRAAEATGLLTPEAIKEAGRTAPSYFMRVYNVKNIVANRDAFVRLLADEMQLHAADLLEGSRLDRLEAVDIAEKITNKIVGNPEGLVWNLRDEFTNDVTGALARRTLIFITDARLEAGGWLIDDIHEVAQTMWRSMAPDVTIAAEIGDVTGESLIGRINDEYEALIRNVDIRDRSSLPPEAAARARTALQQRWHHDIDDIQGIIDRLRGRFKMPQNEMQAALQRAATVVKALQFSWSLGRVVLSSLADPFKIVMYSGMKRTMRYGVQPFVHGLKGIRLSIAEARMANVANDMLRASQFASYADLAEVHGMSGASRVATWITNKANRVFLAAHWNSAAQGLAAVVSQGRMIQAIRDEVAGLAVPAREISEFNRIGLSAPLRARIAKQLEVWSSDVDGLPIAGLASWTDDEARRGYTAALSQITREIIVMPGQDKPFWLSTNWGSVIGQFQSFGMASTQRTMLYALSRHDAATFGSLAMMVATGMLGNWLKAQLGGYKEPERWETWLWDAIDAGGVAAWLSNASTLLERTSGGRLGIRAMFEPENAKRRFLGTNLLAALGPSASTAKNVADLVTDALSGSITGRDVHTAVRLIPLSNTFYLQWLFNGIEDGVRESSGLPARM